MSFFPIELCQGTIRDQNYYAVCRSVLADIGSRRGLLHSPPEENDFKVMLHDALTECVEAKKIRRTEAIELVMGLLQSKINQANVIIHHGSAKQEFTDASVRKFLFG